MDKYVVDRFDLHRDPNLDFHRSPVQKEKTTRGDGAMDGRGKESLLRSIRESLAPAFKYSVGDRRFGRSNYHLDDTAARVRPFVNMLYSLPSTHPVAHLVGYLDDLGLDRTERANFLEASARMLGEDWTTDSSNFTEVTFAMGRLQIVTRRSFEWDAQLSTGAVTGSALLTVPPGEEHIFALVLVEQLFLVNGWHTKCHTPTSIEELQKEIESFNYDVVCISWASGFLLEEFTACIECINKFRTAGRPKVLAGGYAADKNRDRLAELGVYQVCDNIHHALKYAQYHIDVRGVSR